jgi:hypothetical protein
LLPVGRFSKAAALALRPFSSLTIPYFHGEVDSQKGCFAGALRPASSGSIY